MNYSALFKISMPEIFLRQADSLNPGLPVLMMFTALRLYHECSDECKDRIELRECGVDHSVCLNVVAL